MGGGTNLVFFTLIYAKLTDMINNFSQALMGRVMIWVSGLALVLVTIWILILGFRVITGTLRESMTAVVTNMARVVIIVTVATGISIFGPDVNYVLTTGLGSEINTLISNDSGSAASQIDANLAYTEVAMSAIDAIQIVAEDQKSISDQQRASDWSIFGTAGPPITAAVLLLFYEFGMALFIGLGPLFVLCLLFEQTKPLFSRWLLYGVGTLFSIALLNVVVAMVLKISIAVAAGMWTQAILQHFFGNGVEGVNHQALEQGGLGLILTMLIISVPPMASQFFQGTLGSFMHYGGFNSAPPGKGIPQGAAPATNPTNTGSQQGNGGFNGSNAGTQRGTGPATDTMKTSYGHTSGSIFGGLTGGGYKAKDS